MRRKQKEHTFSSNSFTVKFTLLFYSAKSGPFWPTRFKGLSSPCPSVRKTLETRSLMQRTVLHAYSFLLINRVVFQFVKGQLHVISLQRVLALNIDIIL